LNWWIKKKDMNITKCDICKKVIKDGEKLRVSPEGGSFLGFEICSKCGEPVTRFLKSKKLIKDKK